MAKIPIKFKRVAEVFDESAKWRPGQHCESSSGSDYWPDSGTSLSDLVNSFIDNGDGLDPFYMDTNLNMDQNDDINNDKKDREFDSDNEVDESVSGLLSDCKIDNKKGVKRTLFDEIQVGLKLVGVRDNSSRSDRKRKVMSHLRDKGFDAGLCKSRWEKTGRYPAGTHEYIDVNVRKTRYIVELFMNEELDIARPTTRYTALLNLIPSIMIIDNPQLLKQIIRLMSKAMKDSLKHVDMHVAPWRRNGYIQARYFSPYKRTTNRESSSNTAKLAVDGLSNKRLMVGFESNLNRVSYYCRDNVDFVGNGGVRVGLLSSALQGEQFLH